MRKMLSAAALALLSTLSATAVGAAELTTDYLVGRWTTGTVAACGKPESEITEFRADGTFTTTANGRAVGVGFWTLDGDQLELELLAQDALHPALQAVPGDYGQFTIRGLIFDVTEQDHRMVTSIGDSLQGSTVVRCPS